jgi:hypothetical protein
MELLILGILDAFSFEIGVLGKNKKGVFISVGIL